MATFGEPKLCCCGIRTGSIVVFYFQMIVVLLAAGTGLTSYSLLLSEELSKRKLNENAGVTDVPDIQIDWINIAFIAVYVLFILAIIPSAILAHYGATTRRSSFLTPLWMLDIFLLVYTGFLCFICFLAALEDRIYWIFFVVVLVLTAIFAFSTKTLVKCYKWLRLSKGRQARAVYNTYFGTTKRKETQIIQSQFSWDV